MLVKGADVVAISRDSDDQWSSIGLVYMQDLHLTHWGRVTHISVSKLTIIYSDNGLSPGQRQAIRWINAGILLIWTIGANFTEILSEIHIFLIKKMHLKISSGKWWTFCPCLNSLWPNDAIWQYRSGSTLTQIMACWLMAPSHYLNKYWLIISEAQWYSY